MNGDFPADYHLPCYPFNLSWHSLNVPFSTYIVLLPNLEAVSTKDTLVPVPKSMTSHNFWGQSWNHSYGREYHRNLMINRPQILLTMTAFPWKLPQLLIVILLENQLSNLLKLGQVLKKHCIASHQSTAEVKI